MDLPLSNGAKVRLYKEPVDMRNGMFRLQTLIYSAQGSTTEGAYYFFVNRPMSLLKVVWFDGTGLCLLIKRLEKGCFSWPSPAIQSDSPWVELEPTAEAQSTEKPCDKLKKAIEYTLKRQAMLTTWLEEAYIPYRQQARGTPRSGGASQLAVFRLGRRRRKCGHPLHDVQECERCKVDALACLTRVLEILPTYRGDYLDLLPGSLELPATTSKAL